MRPLALSFLILATLLLGVGSVNDGYAQQFDFSVSVEPTTATVSLGGSITATVTVTLLSGQPETVLLFAGGLPTDAAATGQPRDGIPTFTSTMTITTQTTTPTGSFDITIWGQATVSNFVRWTIFTLVVQTTPANNLPNLRPIGNKTVEEETLLGFQVTGTDPDPGQTLTLTATGLPTGASFASTPSTGPATGSFSWTPTELQGPNSFKITFTVTDTFNPPGTASEEITINVGEVNRPPFLAAVGSRTVSHGSALTFGAAATDPDLPIQPLTFSLTQAATGTFPQGATISIYGSFTWTPTEAQGPGTYTARIVVTDGLATDFEDFTITVTGRVTTIDLLMANWSLVLTGLVAGGLLGIGYMAYTPCKLIHPIVCAAFKILRLKGDAIIWDPCPDCGGTGQKKKGMKKCPGCGGTKQVSEPCAACGGTGFETKSCASCGGTGTVPPPKTPHLHARGQTCDECRGTCSKCAGTGNVFPPEKCKSCGGTGKSERLIECPTCKGKGEVDDVEKCGKCGGSGKVARDPW